MHRHNSSRATAIVRFANTVRQAQSCKKKLNFLRFGARSARMGGGGGLGKRARFARSNPEFSVTSVTGCGGNQGMKMCSRW